MPKPPQPTIHLLITFPLPTHYLLTKLNPHSTPTMHSHPIPPSLHRSPNRPPRHIPILPPTSRQASLHHARTYQHESTQHLSYLPNHTPRAGPWGRRTPRPRGRWPRWRGDPPPRGPGPGLLGARPGPVVGPCASAVVYADASDGVSELHVGSGRHAGFST